MEEGYKRFGSETALSPLVINQFIPNAFPNAPNKLEQCRGVRLRAPG